MTAYRSQHAAKVAAAHFVRRGRIVDGIELMWVVRLRKPKAKSRKIK